MLFAKCAGVVGTRGAAVALVTLGGPVHVGSDRAALHKRCTRGAVAS